MMRSSRFYRVAGIIGLLGMGIWLAFLSMGHSELEIEIDRIQIQQQEREAWLDWQLIGEPDPQRSDATQVVTSERFHGKLLALILEAYGGRFTLRCVFYLEEFDLRDAEHGCDQVGREYLHFRVQCTRIGVVEAT